MYQLINAVLSDPEDTTELFLLFANQSEDDILCRDYLENLKNAHEGRFHLWYTVDREKPGWKYSVGFVNSSMIEQHLPPPSSSTAILLCGPPPMINFVCNPNLDKLGYSLANRFSF